MICLVRGTAKSHGKKSTSREGGRIGALVAVYLMYPRTSKTKTNGYHFSA